MIRFRKETEPVKTGLNIYPRDDERSIGAVVSWTWKGMRYAYFMRRPKFNGSVKVPFYLFWTFALVKERIL